MEGTLEEDSTEGLLLTAVKENNLEATRRLLSSHPNIDIHRLGYGVLEDTKSKNLLCVAAQEGHVGMVEELCRSWGAQPDSADLSDTMWQRRAIHHAAARGHVQVVQQLIECGSDTNVCDADSRTPLYWAATNGWVAVAEFLLKHGANISMTQRDGFTPLHASTYLGHLSMCQFLIANRADINSADRDGWTPLHAAVCYNHLDVVRLYLRSGAYVNHKTSDQETPLHIAIEHGHRDILSDLLAYGARLEERNGDGASPFFESVWRNKYQVAKYLINMGADLSVRNDAGVTALYISTLRYYDRDMSKPSLTELMLAAGCDLQSEAWIRSDSVPGYGVSNEHKELLNWLRYRACNPASLQQLSSWVVRKQLGQNISNKAKLLPTPGKLQDFVALELL